jgi:hypothetical protein
MMRIVWLMIASLVLALVCGCGGSGMHAATKSEPGHFGGEADDAEMDRGAPAPMMVMEEGDRSDSAIGHGGMPMRGADERVAMNRPGDPPAGGAPPPPPQQSPKPHVDAGGPVTPKAAKTAAPLLIYRATFHMGVYEATPSIDAVHKLAKELGGYLVRRDSRSIVVRVPTAKYRGALDIIAKLGDVLHREEDVEDVTEQFYDMKTRLRNAHAMRDRLEQLLHKAKDVKEALAVEKELGRITAQIEAMEGKLKRLRELINFSTITVQFKPRPSENVDSNVKLPFPWLDRMGLSNLLNL